MNLITTKIIADSISEQGIRITTMHLHYPRIVHSELMTHRVFSRNARSSRAVPVQKMLDEVRNTPFVPWHWGKNQKGMQASEECNAPINMGSVDGMCVGLDFSREEAWLLARDKAVDAAEAFLDAGYHKQIANRLLEPFTYIDTLVTSTDFANWDALRDHKDAEPHIRDLAISMKFSRNNSTPKILRFGSWHLPYIDHETAENLWESGFYDKLDSSEWAEKGTEVLTKISVARCARISYRPFDGNGDIASEIRRHDDLVGSTPLHASPAEHQATPDMKTSPDERKIIGSQWFCPDLHGNFYGWKQYRKMLPNECVRECP